MLDLGANAELLDGDKRKASHYSASESVRALLESDWELGEKTREGSTLTENGDVVSATGIVIEVRPEIDLCLLVCLLLPPSLFVLN